MKRFQVNFVTFGFWLIDMPLNCFFGVQRKGIVELRWKVLASIYFRSWFAMDCLIISIDLARFIAEAIFAGTDVSGGLSGGRYLRALRILRLLRLTRIGKLQKKFAILANRFPLHLRLYGAQGHLDLDTHAGHQPHYRLLLVWRGQHRLQQLAELHGSRRQRLQLLHRKPSLVPHAVHPVHQQHRACQCAR